MADIHRLRRAGGGVLRLLHALLPLELPGPWPSQGDQEIGLVFADVEGYTDFVAATDDDAAVAVLKTLDRAVAETLKTHGSGRVVKRLGDGLMIAATRATEAVPIAVQLVDAFARRSAQQGWDLRLRAGAHRGTCRRLGNDFFGYHVNLAARVADTAAGGEVLSTANALAGNHLDELGLSPHMAGSLQAKGVSSRVPLFAVHAVDSAEHGAA